MPVRKSLDIVNLLLEAACAVEDKILLYPTVWFLQAISIVRIIELLRRQS